MNETSLFFDEIRPDQLGKAGGKGGSLARLYQAGYPVPAGFVILPHAFNGHDLLPGVWADVQKHLARLRGADPQAAFAVRSSALSEDSEHTSFAGEFETLLNMRSDEDVYGAVLKVYASRHNERVLAYSRAKGMDAEHQIAIVVQLLVRGESSGVLFTANPVSGRRDQGMITAAWGLGEAIVGGVVTPDTLIVDKTSGKVISREIADKQFMTVALEEGTDERPVPDNLRKSEVLNAAQIAELAAMGVELERFYGKPMDIEWVYAAGKCILVQARPITVLPDPEPPAPDAWPLPKGVYAVMRNNIVELMPNPLTPLFDTLGRATINRSLGRQMDRFLGKPGIMPGELIITVNGYAYNNGSINPLRAFGLVFDTVNIVRRMLRGCVERWRESGRPRYLATIAELQHSKIERTSATVLLRTAGELFEAVIDAYGSLISGLIPAAWITEAMFTRFYNALVKRRGDPSAQTFLLGFDSLPIQGEKELYAMAVWVREEPRLARYLTETPAALLADQLWTNQPPAQVEENVWRDWRYRFRSHLAQYGHLIYDLDFSNPLPAEDPIPLIETFKLFAGGQGVDPNARQAETAARREKARLDIEGRLKGPGLKFFRRLLANAQRFAPLRENGLADVGLGYPLLRRILKELGRRLAEGGLLSQAQDIYWLTQEEIERAALRLDQGDALLSADAVVAERKAVWRAARRVTPPMMLPQMKVLGLDLAEIKSRRGRKMKGPMIKGVAASSGSVTARACVISGPEDFARLRTGDVLVAAITTPAWTPLFARASAVVTDVGGPLSHGSIVAREYGIPAVLGTGVATQRIRDGQTVTVDGDAGTVRLHEGEKP